VASKDPIPNLKETAKYLKNAAPRQFELFVDAFRIYAEAAYAAVVDASSEQVYQAQGQAKQCRALHRLLLECDQVRPAAQ
jgi:hypothetical protein